MLELRDGRRVSIPLSLLHSLASLDVEEPQAVDEPDPYAEAGVGTDGEDSLHGGDTEVWGEAEGDDDDVSVIWEDTLFIGEEGSLLCWRNENSPLEIAPLAMAGPGPDAVTAKSDGEVCPHTLPQDTGMASAPSEWVSETMTAFGIVMGASFEGHEEQIMSILQDIKNRRNQQGAGKVKGAKTGGKGSRELRNLISNINYDGGSARKRGTTSDKGLMCYPCS